MRPFLPEQRSLFGSVLDWMLAPLVLLWLGSLVLTWLVAHGIANRLYDPALADTASALAQQVQRHATQHGSLPAWAAGSDALANGTTSSHPHTSAPTERHVLVRLTDSQGQQLTAAPWVNLPLSSITQEKYMAYSAIPIENIQIPLPAPPAQQPQQALPTHTVRVATVQVQIAPSIRTPTPSSPPIHAQRKENQRYPAYSPDEYAVHPLPIVPRHITVQVAEKRDARDALASSIIYGVMLPQTLMLPLTVLLVWLALGRAMRPLEAFQAHIRRRPPDDLSPLNRMAAPLEVAPLVDAVNSLMQHQKDVADNQKRFLANAAHQLKTPLAGLRMQADLAQRSDASADDLKRSLEHIGRSSIRATHTVNQLLALSRAENSAMPTQPCNMAALVQDVVRQSLQRALDKGIDLGYEGAHPTDAGVHIHGNPILLQEMVRNLLHNAINYTPAQQDGLQGIVTARVLVDLYGHVLVVQVEDNGCGIAAAEREKIFQPFYRTLGTGADGSGLGLPIVEEIARRHHATITLTDTYPRHPQRKGALFTLRFATLKDL